MTSSIGRRRLGWTRILGVFVRGIHSSGLHYTRLERNAQRKTCMSQRPSIQNINPGGVVRSRIIRKDVKVQN